MKKIFCTVLAALLLCAPALASDEPAPTVKLSADGSTAMAEGFDGLYARAALLYEQNGATGLLVIQVPVNDDGSIVMPALWMQGLRLKAVSIALVPTLEDIRRPAPAWEAMDYLPLG